jgi:hypothetical protein
VRPEFMTWLSSAALCSVLAACGDDSTAQPSGAGGSGSAGAPSSSDSGSSSTGDPAAPPASPKALVKLKTGDRFAADLARALELDRAEVCRELDRYDCIGVHGVVMGNADPYLSALYEPLDQTTATSPLAYERVALSGCMVRVDRDRSSSAPAIFAGLPSSGGAISGSVDDVLRPIVASLFERMLSRAASDQEIAATVALYDGVAKVDPVAPSRSWAVAACLAVATSVENVFY